jgi:hypothetical protein
MPTPDAIIVNPTGDLPALSFTDEPNLLLTSLRIVPEIEKQGFRGPTQVTTIVRFRDPVLAFQFRGLITAFSGMADQHPGTTVASLANFASAMMGFDPVDGTLIYEDPARDLDDANPESCEFTVRHYPFVS